MALVQVVDGRLVPERGERAHPGDADHDLLADPLLPVDRVQARDEGVRLEQIQRDAAHVEPPDVDRDDLAREIDLDGDVLLDQPDAREIGLRVLLALPPVLVDDLGEIALAVEEADRDERQPEVGGGLEVVAREHAEPARVDREAVVDRELHREVRHYHARTLPADSAHVTAR